jgi:hypothetical protein
MKVALPKMPALKLPAIIPRILNPFDWSVDRPEYKPIEGQAYFRQLGISPDATFDEIKAQASI